MIFSSTGLLQTEERAAKMSDKPQEYKVICPNCKVPMQLRPSKYGWFYGCTNWPDCDVTHCCHQPGTSTAGKPMGYPGDKATRKARHEAHLAFDKIWKGGKMKRRDAYTWLREQLGISKWKCHIGRMNVKRCEEIIRLCKERTGES